MKPMNLLRLIIKGYAMDYIRNMIMGKMKTFSLEQIEELIDDNGGFCIKCGAEHYGVEPDARGYECEECGRSSVYGAEEIMLMGLVSENPENQSLDSYTSLEDPIKVK